MRCRLLVFASVLLASCATTANFEKTLQSWVGKDVDRLIAEWGPPQSSFLLRDGGQVLEWTRQRTAQVGGFRYSTPQTTYEAGKVTVQTPGGRVTGTGTYSGTTTTYVQKQTSVYNVQQSCSARFTVTGQGKISAWAWQGNSCQALPSDSADEVESARAIAPLTSEPFVPEAQRGIVAGSKVQLSMEPMALYKEASSDSQRLVRIYKADVLVVQQVAGDWLLVRAPDATQGWILRTWIGSSR